MDTAVTAWGPARRLVPGLLAPVATVAVAAAGLRVSGLGVIDAIGFALVIAWAIAATVLARAADRTAVLADRAGRAGRRGRADRGPDGPEQQHAARVLATLAGPLVIAISFHFLIALPDGRLGRPGWRLVAALGYATAVGTGIGLAVAGEPFPLMAGGLIWLLAVLTALPVTRLRYLKAAGRDKERMQWLGTGVVVAATVALISAVLHLLVGWPESAGAVAASASAVVPLAVILGRMAAAGAARRKCPGARAVGRGFGRRGRGRLPGDRARPRGGARRQRRPQAPRLLHRRGRAGRDRVPAGQGAPGRLRHQVRVRHPGGTGRVAAHVRQPDDPRRVNGRAAAAAGRVAAQDHAA